MKTLSSFPALAAAGMLAVGTLLFTSGCLAVATGAGAGAAVAYVRGSLDASLGHSFDRVVAATNQAVEQLGFIKVSEKKDALVATIVARDADDRKIEIRIENAGENLAKTHIRVGMLGDEEASRVVLDKITANL